VASRERQAPAHVAPDTARTGYDEAKVAIRGHPMHPRLRTCFVARRTGADKRGRTL
jgi:hypothetical protein